MINEHDIDELLKEILENEEPIDEEFLQDFILEATEHLENIESQVIDLEKDTQNEEIIHSMFRSFHTIKGLAGFVNQRLVQKIAHQTETLMDSCRKGEISVDKELINLILASSDFITKTCANVEIAKNKEFLTVVCEHLEKLELYEQKAVLKKQNVELSEEPKEQESNNEPKEEDNENCECHKKIGEILIEQGIMDIPDVVDVMLEQKEQHPDMKFGEIAVKTGKVDETELAGALKTQQSKPTVAEEYMRISTNKVDSLVDMVGELIIANSLIEQHAINHYDTDNFFITNLGRMTRITKDIQNLSMFLRMVSVKSTFQKITRIARDTINELGKDINFTTSGDDTEIDRVVTEKLLDPLVHLVKNAISHGIEEPEERIASGKSAQGNVRVNAYNKRGYIYIEIVDDGKGINTERVYKKAREKGLINPDKECSEQEIIEFIMLPGFSTLDVANTISGRGVGMDVVKTEVAKAGGKVEINSVSGKGSTFVLKIPVNHAVMNGTIVEIEGSNYIIPTVNVKQILQPKEEQWISMQGAKSMIKVREDIIPLISISKLFKRDNTDDETPKLVVIVELEHKFKALPVQNVVGRREIVVKPVSDQFANLKYISGVSILGDGKVSLILDVDNLFSKEGAI